MEDRLLQFVLERDGATNDVAGLGADFDVANGQLGCIQNDLIHRLVHRDVDLDRSRKGGRANVGLKLYAVQMRFDRSGQAKGILMGCRWGNKRRRHCREGYPPRSE